MATQTTTTVVAPWANQIPYLNQVFSEAQRLYGTGGPTYYPESTVAPLSAQTTNALNATYALGMNQPGYIGAAGDLLRGTLAGDYLNANPYLDAMYDRAAEAVTRNFNESVLPGVSARFGMSGRSGSGLMQNAVGSAYDALGRNLTGMASDIYGANFQNERNRQLQAAQLAPGLQQAQFSGLGQAIQAGQMFDTHAQNVLTDKVNRHNFNQMRPFENLARYSSMVGGSLGSQSTSQQPVYNNNWATAAGLGLGILGAFL